MAETFYKGLTEKDISEAEITRDLVVQVIEENLIAEKVYKQIIADYDFEISEEEARMTTFYDIVFECYKAKMMERWKNIQRRKRQPSCKRQMRHCPPWHRMRMSLTIQS